jgi:hypothetical protein
MKLPEADQLEEADGDKKEPTRISQRMTGLLSKILGSHSSKSDES